MSLPVHLLDIEAARLASLEMPVLIGGFMLLVE